MQAVSGTGQKRTASKRGDMLPLVFDSRERKENLRTLRSKKTAPNRNTADTDSPGENDRESAGER